jgi:hypothetical protein
MFKEVASLDAEVTVALGKTDKKTGKAYPKSAEGYYLGSRKVENKRGESVLHFLQTAKGNLGVWGTTDLNRKLGQVASGTMVRVTSTGTKATPNGEMYTYKVELDNDNTIDVSGLSENESSYADEQEESSSYSDQDDDNSGDNQEEDDTYAIAAAQQAERAAKVQALLKGKNVSKTTKN